MRTGSIAAAAWLALSPMGAHAQTPAPKGSQAEQVIRGEVLPEGPLVHDQPLPTPSVSELERNRAAAERQEILRGRRGPFKQAIAAVEDKDWYSLGLAAAMITTWLVGALLVIWLLGKIIAWGRRH